MISDVFTGQSFIHRGTDLRCTFYTYISTLLSPVAPGLRDHMSLPVAGSKLATKLP